MNFDREKLSQTDMYVTCLEEVLLAVENSTENNKNWHNTWTENSDANWDTARDEEWIDNRYGKSTGPVIICGAGPSLSSPANMAALKMMFDCGVPIFAVDRAYRTLIENGVAPWMTFTDDGQECVTEFFKDLPMIGDFSVNIVAHPAVVAMVPKEQRVWHGGINPFSYWWNLAYQRFSPRIGTNLTGCVVGFTCADAACWMGHTTVISIGNDLGWPDEVEARKNSPYDLFQGEKGDVTCSAFLRAEVMFANLTAWHPERRFVDCSGSFVRFWEKKTLKEMKEEWLCAYSM